MISNLSTYIVIGIAIAIAIALLIIFSRLKAQGSAWSLADALSEETEIATEPKSDGTPLLNTQGNVATRIVMKASSSRLIALLGLVAIMMLYIGAGLVILNSFATAGTVPADTAKITDYLLYGIIMFAPYIVNKFASIFEWMK